MKFYRSHFGRKLRAALRSAGLSQKQLAEHRMIDVDPSAVSKWVGGQDMPAEDRLLAICEVLGVDEDYFEIDGLSPDFGPASDFLAKFASLEPDLQRIVLAVLYPDSGHLKRLSPEFREQFSRLLSSLERAPQSRA